MINYKNCINIKIRRKKGIVYFYCTHIKKEINLNQCNGCRDRQYKTYKTLKTKTELKKVNKRNKVTKATSIPKKVKLIVWNRDDHKCIFCHTSVEWNMANSHYIKRSHLGMGIEENIMTNCQTCHEKFEESSEREKMKEFAKEYLKSKYTNWNEEKLIYKKSI